MLPFGVLSLKSQLSGHFFFEDDDGCAVIVNAKHYANILKNFFFGITSKAYCNEEDMVLTR